MSIQQPSLLDRIGIGGLTTFIFAVGGIIFWLTQWRYELVLRNVPGALNVMGAPKPFWQLGLMLSVVVLAFFVLLATVRGWKMGWRLLEGKRVGIMQWEYCIGGVVTGVLMGTIGTLLFVNSYFDSSPPRTYYTRVIQHDSRMRRHGFSYFLTLADWQHPSQEVTISVRSGTYQSHPVDTPVTITTRRGFLGYEWIVSLQ